MKKIPYWENFIILIGFRTARWTPRTPYMLTPSCMTMNGLMSSVMMASWVEITAQTVAVMMSNHWVKWCHFLWSSVRTCGISCVSVCVCALCVLCVYLHMYACFLCCVDVLESVCAYSPPNKKRNKQKTTPNQAGNKQVYIINKTKYPVCM